MCAPLWPDDTVDANYQNDPVYRRITIYNVFTGFVMLAPLLAISIYWNLSEDFRCQHSNVNRYVSATMSAYVSLLLQLVLQSFFRKMWQGRRQQYFETFTVTVCLYAGIFVGVSLSKGLVLSC